MAIVKAAYQRLERAFEKLTSLEMKGQLDENDIYDAVAFVVQHHHRYGRQRIRKCEGANIYRALYSATANGYVVYRHVFDETKVNVEACANAHREAVFTAKNAAQDYCRYRNEGIVRHGSDAVELLGKR